MIEDLIEQIEARFAELSEQMTEPEVIGDRERYAEVGRAYRQLEPAAKLAKEWRRARDDAAGAQELISEDGDDAELRELLEGARERIEALEEEIRFAMVERDPNDEKNVIVEIQGGAGGDEAGLWAGDVYRMLTRYAAGHGHCRVGRCAKQTPAAHPYRPGHNHGCRYRTHAGITTTASTSDRFGSAAGSPVRRARVCRRRTRTAGRHDGRRRKPRVWRRPAAAVRPGRSRDQRL